MSEEALANQLLTDPSFIAELLSLEGEAPRQPAGDALDGEEPAGDTHDDEKLDTKGVWDENFCIEGNLGDPSLFEEF